MKCKADGCTRAVMYSGKQLCQMHYFRIMRNGSLESLREKQVRETGTSKKYRQQNPAGYQKLNEPNHPLVDSAGYVYEHRYVVYAKYGEHLPECEICGKATSWSTCHIDHIDEDVSNNKLENLRPVCQGCNTGRTERSTIKRLEHDGKSLTFAQWSREPGVEVGPWQIRNRLNAGMSVEDAIFKKNVTHPPKSIIELQEIKATYSAKVRAAKKEIS